jgi:hypothetical protein
LLVDTHRSAYELQLQSKATEHTAAIDLRKLLSSPTAALPTATFDYIK